MKAHRIVVLSGLLLSSLLLAAPGWAASPHPASPPAKVQPNSATSTAANHQGATQTTPTSASAQPIDMASPIGLTVGDMTQAQRQQAGAPQNQGVVVARVQPGSAAQAAGIQVGDVILEADGSPVFSAQALDQALTPRAGQGVALALLRSGQHLSLTARVPSTPPVTHTASIVSTTHSMSSTASPTTPAASGTQSVPAIR